MTATPSTLPPANTTALAAILRDLEAAGARISAMTVLAAATDRGLGSHEAEHVVAAWKASQREQRP